MYLESLWALYYTVFLSGGIELMDSYESLDKAIKGVFGEDVRMSKDSRISRQDINAAKVLTLSNSKMLFLKYNSITNKAFFDAEIEGIEAIASTGAIDTPKIYCTGIDKKTNISFIMMELIQEGVKTERAIGMLGNKLANMHLADTSKFVKDGKYGFVHDNYIGSIKQINTPKDSWIDFFRECRLLPQIKLAEKTLAPMMREVNRFLDRLDTLLIEPKRPSLVHGDMWGGNHIINHNRKPVLIDPAVYVGHSEVDIAMTRMFQPFPRIFYDAYYKKIPRVDGFDDRTEIYNLYHYLNHFNIFGVKYLMPIKKTILKYI